MSANTSNRGYTYPQSTDDFRPYEDIQELAEDVDVDVAALVVRILALEAKLPIMAIKTADETSGLSTTTLQNDDHLFVSVAASTKYNVTGWIMTSATGASPDLKLNYTYPAGATFIRTDWGPATTSTVVADTIDTSPATTGDSARGSGSTRSIYIQGELTVGVTAGTFRVQWAPNVSDGANTVTVKASSRIVLQKQF